MNIFKKFSLYTKILLVILSLTFGVTFSSIAILIQNDFPENRELISLFNEIMDHSSAIASALIENNQDTADEHLNKLRVNPNILSAEIFYYKNGSFVKSETDISESDTMPVTPQQKTSYFAFSFLNKKLEFMYPILKEGHTIGAIHINAANTNNYFGVLLEMSVLVTLIAIFIAMYLTELITNPLNSLVVAMKNVSSQNDYSIRVKKETGGEVGVLIDNFNVMLEKIQINERMQRASEDQIKKLSYYDSLTGLPNREFFSKLLEQALMESRRNNQKLALLYLSLDNFKTINDGLGHDKGDLCLQKTAHALLEHLKSMANLPNDTSQEENIFPFGIARIIGDEFIITIANIKKIEEVETIAKTLIAVIHQPYKIKGEKITLTASVGVAVFPEHSDEGKNLIIHARTALYMAKEQGTGQYQLFNKNMSIMISKLAEKFRLENDLRSALQNNELILYFQPKYSLSTKKILGIEALLRWQHPSLGLVPPDEFIYLAERTGLIIQIGAWVLLEGCHQCKKWRDAGYPIHISVNLSPRQFVNPDLISSVQRAISESGLNAEYLELELTESTIMLSDEQTLNTLHALKKLKVELSIDDFGTGYSSLRYLTRYPIDTVKIDKTFITYLLENKNDATITKTIIDLGHNLNLHVVAEGVETIEQLNYLQDLGCDTIQGYIIAKPMPKEDMDIFLKTRM